MLGVPGWMARFPVLASDFQYWIPWSFNHVATLELHGGSKDASSDEGPNGPSSAAGGVFE